MRLFASVMPSADALAHLERAVAAVQGPRSARSGLRWTDPEQWHVTMAFYGDVPDGAWPELAEALGARISPLPAPMVRLRGAGSFAGRNLWVGLAGESEKDGRALAELIAASVAVGGDVGIPPDPRERNRAHLTLARAGGRRDSRPGRRSDPGPDLADTVRALAVYSGPVWRADAVHLVRSRLGEGRGGGPLHEVIAVLEPRG